MTEEEYFKGSQMMTIPFQRYSDPLYECPKCGKNTVCMDLQSCMALTSNPPRYINTYKCLNETCDYEVNR